MTGVRRPLLCHLTFTNTPFECLQGCISKAFYWFKLGYVLWLWQYSNRLLTVDLGHAVMGRSKGVQLLCHFMTPLYVMLTILPFMTGGCKEKVGIKGHCMASKLPCASSKAVTLTSASLHRARLGAIVEVFWLWCPLYMALAAPIGSLRKPCEPLPSALRPDWLYCACRWRQKLTSVRCLQWQESLDTYCGACRPRW